MIEGKLILDACCAGRMFWFNKQHPDALCIDKRERQDITTGSGKNQRERHIIPDVVMDFRKMDLPNNHFKLVVFDPPHLFVGEKSFTATAYGALNRDTWEEDIRAGFSECFRVLQADGILIFKWNEHDVPLKSVLALTEYTPLFGHPSGKAMKTHWVTFMKSDTNLNPHK